jgi:hypothetical protein
VILSPQEQNKLDNYDNIKNELDSWKNQFGAKKPSEIKKELEKQEEAINDNDSLKSQVQRLETLLRGRNSRNNINNNDQKKENKLCEICNQIKYEVFKYSRISARGFDTNHLYRICSFCQKIVQLNHVNA